MTDTTIRRPIKWTSYAETNVGTVRTVNEDSILHKPEVKLWAVADGMGGYEAGDVASNMIVKSLAEVESKETLKDFVNTVEDTIIDANHRIQEYADIMLDGRVLGSTVVTLLIKGTVGVCLWAGDSRLYRFRNGQLQQLSRDHSHVEDMVALGLLSPDDAESHPDSNIITRAVGAQEELYVDINIFSLRMGDILMLCSDGLYKAVELQDIVNAFSLSAPETIVKSLIERSLQQGAKDNVSVIVVKGEAGPIKSKDHTDNPVDQIVEHS